MFRTRFIGVLSFFLVGAGLVLAQSLTSIATASDTIVSGSSAVGTITLSGVAAQGGVTIGLSSSLSPDVSVPSTVTVPAGQSSATFQITSTPHSRTRTFSLKATLQSISRSTDLTVLGDGVSHISVSPSAVYGGQVSYGTVTLLYPAPTGGWTENLSSSLQAYAAVPPSVTVPSGQTSAQFKIVTTSHSRNLTFTIKAYDATTTASNTLNTLVPIGLAASAWPKFHGDLGNTGVGLGSGAKGLLKWRIKTGGAVKSSPVIGVDDTIYVGSEDGNLYAVRSSGSIRWKFNAGAAIDCTPAIGANKALYFVVAHGSGDMYSLNLGGGVNWTSEVGNDGFSSPSIGSDGTVYVGSIPQFSAVDPTSGSIKWKFAIPNDNYDSSSPAVAPNGLIYLSGIPNAGGTSGLAGLYSDGTWQWGSNYDIYSSSPVLDREGNFYFINVGAFYKFSASDQELGYFQFSVSNQVLTCPAIAQDGTVYVSTVAGFYALDSNLNLKWSLPTILSDGSSPAIAADGTVYVGSTDGNLYAVSSSGSVLWKFQTGGDVYSSPAIDLDGTVVFGSDDGYLYAIR